MNGYFVKALFVMNRHKLTNLANFFIAGCKIISIRRKSCRLWNCLTPVKIVPYVKNSDHLFISQLILGRSPSGH